MIDKQTQFKIQAFLDGELTEGEAREVAALIATDAKAANLHNELKITRRVLHGSEEQIKVPETREFYWSRISQEIEKQSRAEAILPSVSAWHMIVRWLKPLGVVAATAIVGMFVWQQAEHGTIGDAIVTAQMNSESITFQNNETGTTFVWFTFPAENGVANDANSNTLN